MQTFRIRTLASAFPLALALAWSAPAATALKVDAGEDQTVHTDETTIYLFGQATPDTDGIVYKWTQVSGPANATIKNANSPNSLVGFPAAGAYKFELKGTLGAAVSTDTVQYTVLAAVEFKILKPADGDSVRIGGTYPITWQRDPRLGIQLFLSHGDSLHFGPNTLLDVNGAAGSNDSLVWIWRVSDTLAEGTYYLRAEDYFNHTIVTKPVKVILSKKAAGVLPGPRRASAPAADPAQEPSWLAAGGAIRYYGPDGRLAATRAWKPGERTAAPRLAPGAYRYRARLDDGRAFTGTSRF